MKLALFAQKTPICAKNSSKTLHGNDYCPTFATVFWRILQKIRKINHFIK